MAQDSAAKPERKFIVTMPNMGLSEQQMEGLKSKFHNTIVDSIGKDKAAASNIIIIIIFC